MKECSKSIFRRMTDPNFINRYFVGEGLDVGGKPDPLGLYVELFSRMSSVRTWDWEDGDAQYLQSLRDCSFDFVHSSHCLEHLVDPIDGLRNWFRVLKEGGHLVMTVPDEDMYEQGVFPSTFNRDHKWTFTIYKKRSWSNKSLNLLEVLQNLDDAIEVVKVEQLNATYRFDLPRFDQTLTPVGECGIEVVLRKRPQSEIERGGRWVRSPDQPRKELRVHLNQYMDDKTTLKSANSGKPPFMNDSDI